MKDSEWLSHLGLNEHDEELLLRNQWLSDSHISAVGHLLKEQYPFINGLFSPLIGVSAMGFQPVCDGAVQVHNNESLHWVTSTSGILNEGYVCVYDSLSTGRLVPALRRQLADLYRTLKTHT